MHRSVYRIVSSGLGVWISLQSSAVVRLYHATSFENLADIDVAPAVHKMLAGMLTSITCSQFNCRRELYHSLQILFILVEFYCNKQLFEKEQLSTFF